MNEREWAEMVLEHNASQRHNAERQNPNRLKEMFDAIVKDGQSACVDWIGKSTKKEQAKQGTDAK